MFNKDAIWVGLLTGLGVPFVSYAVLLMVSEHFQVAFFPERSLNDPIFDTLTLQVIALCCNLIPMHLYNKRRLLHAMRGIALATFAYAVVWLILFGVEVFQN